KSLLAIWNLGLPLACLIIALGLNEPVKRGKSLDFLRKKTVDIALLQETHLKIADVHRCQNRHYMIAASSSAPNKTKGVSVLIKRNLKLNILESGADTNGKFCFIKCNFDSVKILILVSSDQSTFFHGW
uniref:Endonuclease/exonuclease/phosphatase domain-containing protein n=1 Tax=Astyanax mexicanus TaxID=7994 RepID=A0A3B1K808_ASTMX